MPGVSRLPRNTVRLRAESLEARDTPAVYAVTGTADGLGTITPTGAGTFDASTLRAAVIAANASPEADTILVPVGTYRLTRTGAFEDAAATGDLDAVGAGGPLTVTGAGPGATVVDGNRTDRSFDVLAGGNLTLTGVTLTNGGNTGGPDFDQGGGGVRVRGGDAHPPERRDRRQLRGGLRRRAVRGGGVRPSPRPTPSSPGTRRSTRAPGSRSAAASRSQRTTTTSPSPGPASPTTSRRTAAGGSIITPGPGRLSGWWTAS